jgi:hypothetical protein
MPVRKVTKKRMTWLIILGSIILLLIIFRLMLPGIVLRAVNKQLQTIPNYTGHVDDIDIALIRGAYKIKGIRLDKTGGKVPVPFFSAELLDLSVEWRALFHGRIVGKIIAEHPELNFVKGPTEETSQTKISKKWTDVIDKIMPLKINRFEIKNGEIHYRDFHTKPKVDIFTEDIHILAQNLSNVNKNKEALPSTVEATSKVYGGNAKLNMKINALNDLPTFDAKATLVSLDITNLNDYLEAYAKLDVKQGRISVYTEAAAKDGKIVGYTKPIIKDLKVVNWERDKGQPLKLAWEALVGTVAWIFKNKSKDQLATKAEFEGDYKKPDVDTWYLIGQVLYNAFIQALYPALENSVNIKELDTKHPDSKLKQEFEKSSAMNKKDDKKDDKKNDKKNEKKDDKKDKSKDNKKDEEKPKS